MLPATCAEHTVCFSCVSAPRRAGPMGQALGAAPAGDRMALEGRLRRSSRREVLGGHSRRRPPLLE